MVMVLRKRVKRVFLKNKAQYIGTILLVALASAVYIVLNHLSLNLKGNFNLFSEKNRIGDAEVILQRPIDSIERLENKYDVVIEERRYLDFDIKEGVTLRVFGRGEEVNIPEVLEGNDIKKDSEILLNPAFAAAQGIKVGDTLKVCDENLTVAGFMTIPDYIYPTKNDSELIYDSKSFGIGVISKEKIKKLSKTILTYNIRYNSENSEEIKEYLNENYNTVFWRDRDENARYTMVKSEIKQLNGIVVIIPLGILMLTCMLLTAIIWRMVKIDFVQIGTLYALGYRKKEILYHYLTYPLIVSLIGSAGGIVISLLTLKPFLYFYTLYFNLPMNNISYRIEYILIGLVMPAVLMLVSVFIIVNRALRLTPLKLMRGYGKSVKMKGLERRLKLNRFSFTTKFRIRESIRNLPKIFIMIFGIITASMFILIGFASNSSMDYFVKEGITNNLRYNYNYVFNTIKTENHYGGEAYNIAPFTAEDEDVLVYGVNKESEIIYLQDSGDRKINLNKTIVTKSLAKKFNLKRGDTIEIKSKLSDKRVKIEIDEIAEMYNGSFIFMELEEFNKLLGYNKGSFAGIFSKDKLDIEGAELIKEESREDTIRAFDSFIKPMRNIMLGIGSLSLVIALTVLYVIISLVVEENKESISMLKVLGYKNKEIDNLVLKTGNFSLIIGYIAAIPILLLSLGKVFESALEEVDMSMAIRIEPVYLVIGFIIILLTYELSKTLAKRKVFSISMAESLKSGRE